MKRLSLYSAICLVILGVYSVSVFSQNLSVCEGRSPGFKYINYGLQNGKGPFKKCVGPDVNERFCKKEKNTLSLDTLQEKANEYMRDFKNSYKDLFELYDLELPKFQVSYTADNKIKIDMTNFPACLRVFDKVGGKLPNKNIQNSNVYVPYLTVGEEFASQCRNAASNKVDCNMKKAGNFFKKIFEGRDAEKLSEDLYFDTNKFITSCMNKTKDKIKRYRGKNNQEKAKEKIEGLLGDQTIIFDEYNYKKQTILSSKDLDNKVGKSDAQGTNDEVCLDNITDLKVPQLYDIDSDLNQNLEYSLYRGCNGADKFADVVDRDLINDLNAISLLLDGESIVSDPGKGGIPDEFNLKLGDLKVDCNENFQNLSSLNSAVSNDPEKFKKFLFSLERNTAERWEEFDGAKNLFEANDINAANRSLGSLQASMKNPQTGGDFYDLDKIYSLAKAFSTDKKTRIYSDKLYDSYRKLKAIRDTKKDFRNIDNVFDSMQKDGIEIETCSAVSDLKNKECRITYAKTNKTLKYLKEKRKDFADEKGLSDDNPFKDVKTASDLPEGAKTLVDSTNFVDMENPTLKDLDTRISLLGNRLKYLKDTFIPSLTEGQKEKLAKCELKDKDYDPAKAEEEFFAKLGNSDPELAEVEDDDKKDTDKKDDDSDAKLDLIKQMMDMNMQMMYANGNSGANNGYYNQVGGGDNAWMMSYMNNFSNQMYNMAFSNYQTQNLLMDRQSSMANNLTNYQFSTTNFLLQNSMLSNFFNQNDPLTNSSFNFMNSFNPSYQTPGYNPALNTFVYNYEIPVFKNEDFEAIIVSI